MNEICSASIKLSTASNDDEVTCSCILKEGHAGSHSLSYDDYFGRTIRVSWTQVPLLDYEPTAEEFLDVPGVRQWFNFISDKFPHLSISKPSLIDDRTYSIKLVISKPKDDFDVISNVKLGDKAFWISIKLEEKAMKDSIMAAMGDDLKTELDNLQLLIDLSCQYKLL